jgi:hypothetical protein
MSLYKERESGDEAARILNSPVWAEAWSAYRARILEEIEAAPSNSTDTVMHLKRLLTASLAARAHLERIMNEGKVAAASIEFDDKRKVSNIGHILGRK